MMLGQLIWSLLTHWGTIYIKPSYLSPQTKARRWHWVNSSKACLTHRGTISTNPKQVLRSTKGTNIRMDQSQKMTLRHHVIENLNDTSHNQTIKQILCHGHNSYKIEPLSKWPMNKNIISKNHSKGIPQVRVISRGVETLISTNKHKTTIHQKTNYQTI